MSTIVTKSPVRRHNSMLGLSIFLILCINMVTDILKSNLGFWENNSCPNIIVPIHLF